MQQTTPYNWLNDIRLYIISSCMCMPSRVEPHTKYPYIRHTYMPYPHIRTRSWSRSLSHKNCFSNIEYICDRYHILHTCMLSCVHACMHISTYVHAYIQSGMHIHTHIHTCIHRNFFYIYITADAPIKQKRLTDW